MAAVGQFNSFLENFQVYFAMTENRLALQVLGGALLCEPSITSIYLAQGSGSWPRTRPERHLLMAVLTLPRVIWEPSNRSQHPIG